MRRRNVLLAFVLMLVGALAPHGTIQEARADLPGFILRIWEFRWGGIWATEYRKREIARWYRHYSWVTNLRLWLKRRAEGVWITGQALQSFTARSHCVIRSPNGRGIWRIWRIYRRVDVVRFRKHYRIYWPGWVNEVVRDAAPPGNVVGGINARFVMTVDHVELVTPMEPSDPNPATPFNENVMIMDENGQTHFLGEPGFELMPDTAMNPNGFQLVTTALTTNDLPPPPERIIDPPMIPMPGSGKVEIQPGVVVQWLVDEGGNVVVPGDPQPVDVAVSGPGGPIPDFVSPNPGVLQRSVSVAETCPIELVQLSLQSVNHTWVGDLEATLTGPNGNTATMFFRVGQNSLTSVGDSTDLNGNYLMADNAPGSLWQQAAALPAGATIPSGQYFNVGPWQNPAHNPPNGPPPNNAFTAAFQGSNPQGNWTLTIRDHAGGDIGNLGAWTLHLRLNCAGPAPDILDDRVLGGQKHQALLDQPTNIPEHELDLDEANVPLQLYCWMLDQSGNVVGERPGVAIIGPPVDLNGDGQVDEHTAFGGPIAMHPTVRDDHDILFPGMAPVDLGVVEEGEPTPQELAEFNNRLIAAGIPPVQPPFQVCINRRVARHIWGIDRRFVMDCWRHHWVWFFAQHITLTTGTHRIWLSRSALSFFSYSSHHFVAGLPPIWRMLTLVHVRFFRVCYRVYCPRPGIIRIRIEQIWAVVPEKPDDPNSPLIMLTTESNENALLPGPILAGLQPDPIPFGPDGVFIEDLGPAPEPTLDMGGGGTNIFSGDLSVIPPDGMTMTEVVMLGNRDFADALRNNQLQLYCWPLDPQGNVRRTTFIVECSRGEGCQLGDEQGHGPSGVLAATSTTSTGFLVSDNFRVKCTHPIRHLCWWGIYFNFATNQECGPGPGDNFIVTYFNDAGGQPGSIRAGPFSVIPTKLNTGRTILPAGPAVDVFAYTADHPPFDANMGECLWVRVENNLPSGSQCFWLWNTAPPGDTLAHQTPAGSTNYDLAFCVDVPIEPNGCAGPVPLVSDMPDDSMKGPMKEGTVLALGDTDPTRLGPPGGPETITFTEDPAPAIPSFVDDMGNPMPNPVNVSFIMTAEPAVPVCCPGNADKVSPGQVNFADVTAVLVNFGMPANPNGTSPGDADCNGSINFADVTSVLVNFLNPCP